MKRPLSVYVHIPFCEKRCGYCDFLSCCELNQLNDYLQYLLAEIRKFDFSGYEVRTIYLGGGTPSLLSPEQVTAILTALPACHGEITMEANPNSLTEAKCQGYREAGVNRLSIGVQSFSDKTLIDLGRLHNVQQAITAIKVANKCFENVSVDLIKDIPGHKFVIPPAEILKLINHISIYSLTKDDRPVLETDESVGLPREFIHYEVSNYARAGYECQHNLVYWQGGEYVGFGAGAHSLLNNVRSYNTNEILEYQRVTLPERTPEIIRDEQIMLGLRLRDGVDLTLLVGKDATIQNLVEQGLVKIKGQKLVVTAKGLKLLNQIWLCLV